MKKIFESLLFILIFIGFPILSGILVEILSNIITMEMIMNTMGILLIICLIYLFKN